MNRNYRNVCDVGPKTYRSRSEIKEDIRYVCSRISEINEMLNIRELISDVFNEEMDYGTIKKAEAITELLKYAQEALAELVELNERLDELKAELISSTDRYISCEGVR